MKNTDNLNYPSFDETKMAKPGLTNQTTPIIMINHILMLTNKGKVFTTIKIPF